MVLHLLFHIKKDLFRRLTKAGLWHFNQLLFLFFHYLYPNTPPPHPNTKEMFPIRQPGAFSFLFLSKHLLIVQAPCEISHSLRSLS